MPRPPRYSPWLLGALLLTACGGESTGTATGTSSSSASAGGSDSTSSSTGSGGGGSGGGETTTNSSASSGVGGAACGPCGEHASCTEATACACDAGFKGDGQTCDDIDECVDQLDNCHATATCTNTDGSFTCACPPGTVGDPLTGCEARYTEITAGLYHTCARRMDDAAVCFGNGGSGRLGNGLSVNQPAPVQAGAASNWAHLSAGTSHTCGIKATGNLWCWGNNGFGQLGLGNNVGQTLPAYTSLDRTWTSVAAGENHTCAVESDGTLSCWGRNAAGQLATGSANAFEYSPVHVNVDPLAAVAEADWKEVFTGRDTTCALKQSGALYCWGQNSDLQVSKPGGGFVAIPYLVVTTPGGMDADWSTVSVGVTTCGLKKTTGAMFCW